MVAARFAAAATVAALVGWGGQIGASRVALAQIDDPRGRPLVDVGPDDFLVEESGASREVLDVRVADYPLAIVVDNGGSAADVDAIRSAAARFIERLGPRPIALVTTAPPAIVSTFEDDRPAVLTRLGELRPASGSRPLEAAAMGAEAIRATGALFSALVVVSGTGAEVTGTETESLLASIIDSRTVVHVIANAATAPAAAADFRLFRQIADQTHGGYTAIYAAASFQPALDRVAARLTTELLIEYLVPIGSRASDVKIGVRIPGARVRGLGVAPK